ncbi:MAG: hypothetical protein IH950_11470, partial [Bacteroidetes bacterium]|nr:hypothetical protein [Bacteroidota bacterium]
MDKKVVLEDLIGGTIDNYKIIEKIKETKKSVVFIGNNPLLKRDDALEILKPNQGEERENQFIEKRKRAAKRGRRNNLLIVYNAGRDKNWGLAYSAFQLITNPNGDFQDEINVGIKFSLEELVHRMTGAINGGANIHIDGETHGDFKLANLKKNVGDEKHEGDGETYVLDEGGRISSEHKYPGDIPALANCFIELCDHCEEQVPKKLEQIIKTTAEGKYNSITDFKRAIDIYRWWNTEIKPLKKGPSITRRKALKVIGGASILFGLGYPSYKYINYKNSIDYIVEQIA